MPFLLQRIIETFAQSAACSVPMMLLIMARIVPGSRTANFIAILLSAFIFLFLSLGRLRKYISSVPDRRQYYRVNAAAFGIYILTALGLIICDQGVLLAWIFLPVKFIQALGVTAMTSTLVFGLCLAGIFLWVPREYSKMLARIRADREIE